MLQDSTTPASRPAGRREAGKETAHSIEQIADFILAHHGAVLQVCKYGRLVVVGKIVPVERWRSYVLALPYGKNRKLPERPSIPLVVFPIAARCGVRDIVVWVQGRRQYGTLPLHEALRLGEVRQQGGLTELFLDWEMFEPTRGVRWPFIEQPVIEVSDALLDALVASDTEASAPEPAGEEVRR